MLVSWEDREAVRSGFLLESSVGLSSQPVDRTSYETSFTWDTFISPLKASRQHWNQTAQAHWKAWRIQFKSSGILHFYGILKQFYTVIENYGFYTLNSPYAPRGGI